MRDWLFDQPKKKPEKDIIIDIEIDLDSVIYVPTWIEKRPEITPTPPLKKPVERIKKR
ncbi:hypothetical protein [Pseudobacteriovorax antillogorgiicola]|uniref:Uncharacterized protein n=1 Tax=Pseudobacteriovorax antillogorgiicola TaxID=1513793 RepID=A0A1Y6BEW4_9BACT|nr:hypothetical protein [Pseudobacteriovorax antillogorgiicola]TCS57440.1 hypothetical protein EDD56_103180 [Pseudobacteriovorax antillogorgiicola]SMF01051.1 hypothetical protein SAMN06296036_103153 [Pseudobacteriovorax antillogorgiicola]